MLSHEMKRAVFSWGMVLASAIVFICLLGFSIPTWQESAESALEYRPSALEQSLGGIFFGGVMLMLPFCAVLPFALSQIDEINTGFHLLRGIRQSVGQYVQHKSIAAMLAGGLSIALPFLLHCCLWNIIALPYQPSIYPDQEIGFYGLYGDWSGILNAWPMYLWIAFGLLLSGALWALVGLSVTVWIPDKLVCIMIPIAICYFWSYGLYGHIIGITLPSPSGLYNDGLTWKRFFQTLGVSTVLGIIAYLVYYIGLKRRLRYV